METKSNDQDSWISFGGESTPFKCASCKATLDEEIAMMDHHQGTCPFCNVKCLFYFWDRPFQIVPGVAPDTMKAFITWAQQELDEIDFSDLLGHLELVVGKRSQDGKSDTAR